MDAKRTIEQKAIQISITGAFSFAILGLMFAIWTGSQAVLLDGAFNLISAIMAIFALKISKLLKEPYSEKFPAGFVALEPFYLLVKGLILFILTAFVITSNVLIMLSGGNELPLGSIVIYIAVAALGNFILYALIRKSANREPSPVLEIEKENWMVNAVISSGIGIAFLIVLLFRDGFLQPVVPYVDQVIVILVGLVSLPIPINAIRNGIGELLLIAPKDEITEKIKNIIKDQMDDTLLEKWQLYILKTGRKYWLNLIVIPVASEIKASFPDDIKSDIESELSKELEHYTLDVLLTKDLNNL